MKLLVGVLPFLGPRSVRDKVQPDPAAFDARLAALTALAVEQSGVLSDPARELWEAEIARLRRLEEKLAAYLTLLTPLIPLVSLAAGAAIAEESLGAFALIVFGIVELAGAYLLVGDAWSSFPMAMIRTDTLEALAPEPNFEDRLAAVRLANAEYNQARGIDLSNRIHGARRSIAWGIGALVVAVLELAKEVAS